MTDVWSRSNRRATSGGYRVVAAASPGCRRRGLRWQQRRNEAEREGNRCRAFRNNAGVRAVLPGLLLASLQVDSTRDIHDAAVGHHLERSLDEAAAGYEDTLRRDPPRELTPAEWRTVERFAPRVFVTRTEPFQLRDAAAIVHPDRRTIAYHLFWDDDIDFPDDNDPSDHEVVWCVISPDQRRLVAFYTYFHNRVLEAPPEALRDAAAHLGRPSVAVQWGKHGSMPVGWQAARRSWRRTARRKPDTIAIDKPITLDDYNRGTWEKLRTEGRRAGGQPDRGPAELAAAVRRDVGGVLHVPAPGRPAAADPVAPRRADLPLERRRLEPLADSLQLPSQARMAGRRRREDDRTGPADDRHRPRAGR